MSWKKTLLTALGVVVVAYLAFGVHVYVQGLSSQLSIHICPPDMLPTSSQIQMEDGSTQTVTHLPDCQTQELRGADVLRDAPVIILGWLPLMAAQMLAASVENARDEGMKDWDEVTWQVQNASTPIATPEWKTYQAKNINITFKYAPHLLLQDVEGGVNMYDDTPDTRTYLADPQTQNEPLGMRIRSHYNPADNQDPEEYMRQALPHQNYSGLNRGLFGLKTLIFYGQGMEKTDHFLFLKDNSVYEIVITYDSPEDLARLDFYKMISSIKFTK